MNKIVKKQNKLESLSRKSLKHQNIVVAPNGQIYFTRNYLGVDQIMAIYYEKKEVDIKKVYETTSEIMGVRISTRERCEDCNHTLYVL